MPQHVTAPQHIGLGTELLPQKATHDTIFLWLPACHASIQQNHSLGKHLTKTDRLTDQSKQQKGTNLCCRTALPEHAS
jgi:hypothetical protein